MRRLVIAAVLLLAASPLAAAEAPKPGYNVLFVAVDDLRPQLGCYGDPLAKTPNLDRWVGDRGTVFNRAYCQQAVCSPSRTSLLTGRRPDTTKVYDLVTHFRDKIPDVVTLPQHFKNNGYDVRGIGKIYHGGYDDAKSWSKPWEGTKAPGFGPEGQKLMTKLRADAKAAGRDVSRVRGLPVEAPDVADDELRDGALARRGCELLRELKDGDKPFFLAVGFYKPHLPFVAPKKYWDLHDPAKLPTASHPNPPKGSPPYAITNFGELRAYHEIPKTGPVSDEMARKLVHGYYACVSYMDAQFGRLIDELGRLGLKDNTVVIFWGDHGWHLNDHGQWCKHTNFEIATRAALLMSRPGQKAPGKKTDALVEFVDIYPTLADVCGLPKPDGVEGYSFAPLLDDPARPWKPAAFSQFPRGGKETGPLMGYAIRTDRYRMVEWRQRNSGKVVSHELYDHQTDPGEDVNIADRPESKGIVEKLSKQLAAGWKANAPPAR
jgi:arylsulfatase A-like enzyme